MAKLIDCCSDVPQGLEVHLFNCIYEDRDLTLPWKSSDAKAVAEAAWGSIDWGKSMAVLGSEIDASAGFQIRFIQLWKV